MDKAAQVLPIVLIVLVFWFLLVRPQRRRQQEMARTQGSLDVGAEVMLGSGIFGRVASLEEQTIHLELAPGTVVKVARQAIVRVVAPDEVPGDDLPAVAPEDLGDHGTDTAQQRAPEDPDDPTHPGR